MTSPLVTLFDLESSPLLGWAWQMYDANILREEKCSKIMSIAWKQLDKEKTYCKAICDNKDYQPGDMDDREVVEQAWKVLDKTDVLITQNGISFDERKLNTRFAFYGLGAPSSFQSIDTLKIAKKEFRFESNKLDSLGHYLGVGGKASTGGMSLWFRCMDGDLEAWEIMKSYNKEDVCLLERVYLKLRPFSRTHPNLGYIGGKGEAVCGSCLSKDLVKRGFSFTMTGRKQRYQCKNCQSWTAGKYERNSFVVEEDDDGNE